jgi:hypothetical protein
VECTAFQLAGALNEDSIREAVDFVTKALLGDGDSSPTVQSTPASSSATQAVAQVQQMQQAVASSGAVAAHSAAATTSPATFHDPLAEIQSIPEEEASAEAGPSHAGRIAAGGAARYTQHMTQCMAVASNETSYMYLFSHALQTHH